MSLFTFPCKTGEPSWNGEVYSLGIVLQTTDEFTIHEADELFNGQRIRAKLQVTAKEGEAPNQLKIPGTDGAHAEIEVEFDVKSFTRKSTGIKFNPKIPRECMNGYHAEDIGPRTGILTILDHKPIPEKRTNTKAVEGQQTFDDHEDTGPMPLEPTTPDEKAGASMKKKRSKSEKPPVDPNAPDIFEAGEQAKEPTKPEIEAAYAAGCEANVDGRSRAGNPHPEGVLSVAWMNGWESAAAHPNAKSRKAKR